MLFPRYFLRGMRNLSLNEIILLSFDAITILAAPRALFDFYLWAIIFACDITIITTHGAWLAYQCPEPVSQTYPWRRTESLVLRMTILISSSVGLGYDFIANNFTIVKTAVWYAIIYLWYVILFVAVYECFYCILKTLNAIDSNWLRGTKGHIGIPNVLSISRIGLALCVPHIFVTQSFGKTLSYTIATIILGFALATDTIDGYLARNLNSITKAGKALDPLGDKLIFYPVAIGFCLITEGHFFFPIDLPFIWITYAAAGLIALRDILIVIWYFIFGKQHVNGISAGVADKLRTIILSIWLVSTTLALTIPDTTLGQAMIWTSFISLISAGIASPISFFVDIYRVLKLKKTQKNSS